MGVCSGSEHGDTVQRHLEYARRIGDLRIVVYNTSSQKPRQFSEQLTVYPTNCRTPLAFLWRAFRLPPRCSATIPPR